MLKASHRLTTPSSRSLCRSAILAACVAALTTIASPANAVALLLVPDSTNDRVMAFDPFSGGLVDANFIGSDPVHLATPKHAIAGPGNTVLVSDQVNDVVQRYSASGTYLGVFAPAGGANTAILDNIRGIARHPSTGNLLVTVAASAQPNSVAQFDAGGNYLGSFIASGAGGLDSPFALAFHSGLNRFLVSSVNTDQILRFDVNGNPDGVFAAIDGYPEQIAVLSNGNVLLGNFAGAQTGVVEFQSNGALVGTYTGVTGNRGVYELGNGNILTTNGSGVHEIDRLGNLVETEFAGVSAHYIELVNLDGASVPEPSTSGILALGLLVLVCAGRRVVR